MKRQSVGGVKRDVGELHREVQNIYRQYLREKRRLQIKRAKTKVYIMGTKEKLEAIRKWELKELTRR